MADIIDGKAFAARLRGEVAEGVAAFRAKVGADRMGELGQKFLAAKRQAPPAPHPHAPDEGRIEKLVARFGSMTFAMAPALFMVFELSGVGIWPGWARRRRGRRLWARAFRCRCLYEWITTSTKSGFSNDTAERSYVSSLNSHPGDHVSHKYLQMS